MTRQKMAKLLIENQYEPKLDRAKPASAILCAEEYGMEPQTATRTVGSRLSLTDEYDRELHQPRDSQTPTVHGSGTTPRHASRCHNAHRGFLTRGAASVRAPGTHGCRDGAGHARLVPRSSPRRGVVGDVAPSPVKSSTLDQMNVRDTGGTSGANEGGRFSGRGRSVNQVIRSEERGTRKSRPRSSIEETTVRGVEDHGNAIGSCVTDGGGDRGLLLL